MGELSVEAQQEISRLKNEVHAKEETLNQLKLKTKSFVDNLRNELSTEKKKVSDLEDQLKHAKENTTGTVAPSGGSGSGSGAEVESLKKEIATVTHRENELKARAKAFADNMKAQLQAEKDKVQKLEHELQEKNAAMVSKSRTSSASNDLHNAANNDEMEKMRKQLADAHHATTSMREHLQRVESSAKLHEHDLEHAKRELEAIRNSSNLQITQLQAEITHLRTREHDLESTLESQRSAQGSAEAAFAQEHGQLEAANSRAQEVSHRLEQYKIENEHLQKQLIDKDFQLEQLESYRLRADESDATANHLRGEIATLQAKLQAQEEESVKACSKCDELKLELSEMSKLYERVNMGRSQSDLQLAEAQTALSSLQAIKQNYDSAQARIEEVTKQNMQLNEKIFQKDSEINAFKSDVQRLSNEIAQLNQNLSASRSDSFSRKQQTELLESEKKKAEDALRGVQTKVAEIEKRNQELVATVEAVTKDSNEKRQKAKALVVSLTNEKQSLGDAKNELQKEVDRLRMELNQKNVENERRLKQLQDENQQRTSQNTSNIQNLNDEISTLKQTLLVIQESERNQQRAKELANAKREVEDSNKKRLAAKAETQKLAIELESVQKCLSQLAESASSSCTSSVKKICSMQDRVSEALQILEKRAAASGKKNQPTSPTSASREVEVEDLRGVEAVARPLSPTSGARKVEESIALLNEKIQALVDATDRLCDLSMEQNDVNLKDVVIDKVSSMFTQCFSEKLRQAYSKVEDSDAGSLLSTKS